MPAIVSAIASELERLGDPPKSRSELEGVYEATLILLYRLLFVLYAEAREYLPVEVSAGYQAHSLRRRLDAIVATVEGDRVPPSTASNIRASSSRNGESRRTGGKQRTYRLTAAGRRRFKEETSYWTKFSDAIGLALKAQPEDV